MTRIIALLTAALIASAPAAAEDKRREPPPPTAEQRTALRTQRFTPPVEFDHPYKGTLTVIRKPTMGQVQKLCPETSFWAKLGCAHHASDFSWCMVALGTDNLIKVMGVDPDVVYRHEIAHCNGWPADHKGSRLGGALTEPQIENVFGLPDLNLLEDAMKEACSQDRNELSETMNAACSRWEETSKAATTRAQWPTSPSSKPTEPELTQEQAQKIVDALNSNLPRVAALKLVRKPTEPTSPANAPEYEVECRVVANVPTPSRSEVRTESIVISNWTGPTPKMIVEHTLADGRRYLRSEQYAEYRVNRKSAQIQWTGRLKKDHAVTMVGTFHWGCPRFC